VKSVSKVLGVTKTARALPNTGVGNHVALAMMLIVSAAIVGRRVVLDR